jgi:hypothetical protein
MRHAHALCRNPGGEIRVDLTVPGAQATLSWDDAAIPTTTTIGGNAATKVIPAKLTISSLASLGLDFSDAPTAIHIDGLARRSVRVFNVVIGVCGAPYNQPLSNRCPAALATESQDFTISLPLELLRTRSLYIFVVTRRNNIRGQLSPQAPLNISGSSSLSFSNLTADMLQEGVNTRTMSFTARASTSNATASFFVTFDNFRGAMTFSSISTTGFGSPSNPNNNVTAVHIHGPCPDRNPCDTGVVYTICGSNGGASSCPTGASPTIPEFNVDTAQSGTDGSSLLGLMTEIQRGEHLYYVNFHTSA